jgi:hypothetical protein
MFSNAERLPVLRHRRATWRFGEQFAREWPLGFSKEFKVAAIRRLQGGQTAAEVARALEVHPTELYRWIPRSIPTVSFRWTPLQSPADFFTVLCFFIAGLL